MTKEEMLKKIGELTPEQKDFLRREVKKHSPSQATQKTPVKDDGKKQSNNKI